MDRTESEKTPLLSGLEYSTDDRLLTSRSIDRKEAGNLSEKEWSRSGTLQLKKHITLIPCIAIVIGNVIGSGIFVAPKGVLENIGSIGGALVIWGAAGILSLGQAFCYAELGSTIPKAGGDFTYLYEIFGPLPAFLCVWAEITICGTSSVAVIALAAALYLIQLTGLECNEFLLTMVAIWIIVSLAILNCYSVTAATKLAVVFTVAKVFALSIIIITGFVKIGQGWTDNFDNMFEGTVTNPGLIGVAALDGYFAYKGWEQVSTMAEEMVNPTRDLPLGLAIGLTSVTSIYILTNVAYFSVLTPSEILSSDAVALTFMERTLGVVMSGVISAFVTISCMGTINGHYLGDSRYLFAAGRPQYQQVPKLFSMIHIRHITPIPAVICVCVISVIYVLAGDIDVLETYASLSVQFKILLSIISLFYLRWKQPDLHRPVKVNLTIPIVTLIVMLGLIGLNLYADPITAGIGVGLFLLGVPVYFLVAYNKDKPCTNQGMGALTRFLQMVFMVVPEKLKKEPMDKCDKTHKQ